MRVGMDERRRLEKVKIQELGRRSKAKEEAILLKTSINTKLTYVFTSAVAFGLIPGEKAYTSADVMLSVFILYSGLYYKSLFADLGMQGQIRTRVALQGEALTRHTRHIVFCTCHTSTQVFTVILKGLPWRF